MTMTTALEVGRPPQQLRDDLWLFPPNRDCQGGSAWWLEVDPEPVLIDCPPLTQASLTALHRGLTRLDEYGLSDQPLLEEQPADCPVPVVHPRLA